MKYNAKFRKGSKSNNEDRNNKENDFKIMVSKILGINEEDLEKSSKLPHATVEDKDNFYVFTTNIRSRNMIFLSRMADILRALILDKKKVTLFITVQTPKSIKNEIFMLKNLGANVEWHIGSQDFIWDNKIDSLFTTKGNTEGLSYKDEKVFISKTDKNFNKFILIYLFLLSKNINLQYSIKENTSPPKKSLELFRDLMKTDISFDIISGTDNKREFLDKFIFDNKLNLVKENNNQKINIERDKNLYTSHNAIMKKVKEYYEDLNYKFATEKFNVDFLACKDNELHICEIKGAFTWSNIFKAVGQLLFYKDVIANKLDWSERNIKLKLFIGYGHSSDILNKFLIKNNIEMEIINA